MTVSSYIFLAILLAGLVTFIPKVLPFIFVKYRGLPPLVMRFLKYLPVSIIFALILSGLFQEENGRVVSVKWLDLIALFPTSYIAFRYKNLLATVLFGVVCLALLRFFF